MLGLTHSCCAVHAVLPCRHLLHQQQQQQYDRTKGIRQHAPTRFATAFFVLEDILESRAAIQLMICNDDWEEAAAGSTNASAFKKAAAGGWAHSNADLQAEGLTPTLKPS
jgi:hypothetical protein